MPTYTRVMLRINVELYERLKQAADAENNGLSALMRRLLSQGLDGLEDPPTESSDRQPLDDIEQAVVKALATIVIRAISDDMAEDSKPRKRKPRAGQARAEGM